VPRPHKMQGRNMSSSTFGLSAARSGSAYLSGFQTLDAEISLPAFPVQGRIPDWLTGTLLREGPGRYEWGPDRYRHWFDGSGMIHKFSFRGGQGRLRKPLCARHRLCRKRARRSHHGADLRDRSRRANGEQNR
jgi:carotenoid cleavage dioxygenase-like enzyme